MNADSEKFGNKHSPGGRNHENHIPWRLAVILLLLSLIVFGNTINQYFFMDDFDVLYSARSDKLRHALLGYNTNLENKFFRPIPMFFYWFQNKSFGLKPWVFHSTSLLLHAITAVVAANLFYLLFRNITVTALFGCVFVIFPNHAEVIHSLAINFTTWSTLFYLLTLNLFAYYRFSSRITFFLLSIVAFLAAIASNESAFTLPAAVVLLDLFLSRSRQLALSFRRRTFEYGAFFALLLLVFILIRTLLHTWTGYFTPAGENIISLYLQDPSTLVFDWARMCFEAWKYLIAPISSLITFQTALIAVIWLLAVITGGFLIVKRRINLMALAFCVCVVLVTVLPMLGTYKVFGITHWVRWLYLPSVASCYIVSMLIGGILNGVRKPWARCAVIGMILGPTVFLTKFYDKQWIEAQTETRRVIESIVGKLQSFPRHSRVYVSGIPWMKSEIPRIDHALPSAVALYLDREHVQAALNFLPANQILALEREEYSESEWHYFWLKWDDKEGTLSEAGEIQPPRSTNRTLYVWDFTDSMNRQRLEVANDMAPARISGFPYPAFMVSGGWAFLKMPVIGPDRPVKYLTLDMMLKTEKIKRIVSRIFWVTENDMVYTGGKSIGFYTMTDGEFHQYKIPLYRNGLSLIEPEIFRFAIRPSQDSGTIFSIRKMTVEYF